MTRTDADQKTPRTFLIWRLAVGLAATAGNCVFRLVFGLAEVLHGGDFPMKPALLKLLLSLCLLPLVARAGDSSLAGRWRLDTTRSTALDGWSTADIVITTDGSKVSLRYDMTWHATQVTAANTVDTAAAAEITNFFRIDQRHMAVYARPKETAHVTAGWLDGGRTLRIEALVPLETSQGNTTMRLYDEYRLLEGGQQLLLIELHSTRERPLVYHFTKVPAEAAKK
jgi:hypothetical protein